MKLSEVRIEKNRDGHKYVAINCRAACAHSSTILIGGWANDSVLMLRSPALHHADPVGNALTLPAWTSRDTVSS
jgi:hypothetical protein